MKYVEATKDSPATLIFGKVLEIIFFKHMIDFFWFSRLSFEFAWWAWGENFALLSLVLCESLEDAFTIIDIRIGKTSISIMWKK